MPSERGPRPSAVFALRCAVAVALSALSLAFACLRPLPPLPVAPPPPVDPVVPYRLAEAGQPRAVFALSGAPFCFSGTSNAYVTYKPRSMVDDVLNQAQAMGLKVLRLWAFEDRGSRDGSVPSVDSSAGGEPGTRDGVYFQYWDERLRRLAYNDGADGLERLDYVVARAGRLGLKVILVLTNNWKQFGGIDQYVVWFGLSHHHDFFSDRSARLAYRQWVTHLAQRVNSVSGLEYRNDPTIFAWELANEPRCGNGGPFDAPDGCPPGVITRWADEMSEYLKTLDSQHLVAVGDEGYFDRGKTAGDLYNGRAGVDHEALLALPNVDYGTFHLYPDQWATGVDFGQRWIVEHLEAAAHAHKPTVLEEYGLAVASETTTGDGAGITRRLAAYDRWNQLLLQGGAAGSMFWQLVGRDPSNTVTGYYADEDHFAVYNRPEDPAARLLSDVAARFTSEASVCKLASRAGLSFGSSRFVSVVSPQETPSPPTVPIEDSAAPTAD
jgi:mannan endo-1,4-beta-mannosidase